MPNPAIMVADGDLIHEIPAEVISKKEYFKRAVNDSAYPAYIRKHWVISILAVTYEEPTAFVNDPYPYRVIRKEDGFYFIDPLRSGAHTRIESKAFGPDVPLIRPEYAVTLNPLDLPNVRKESINTTYGNWLFNALVMVYAFGGKYEYVEGKVKIDRIEAIIESRLEDDVPPGELEDPAKLYVHELIKFSNALGQLQGFNYLLVPSASPKTLTRDPRIPELRAKLLAENADRLHDPAVIAKIDAELQVMDRAWVDDDGKDFYIKNKSFDNVRKKTMLMHGYEKPFSDGEKSTTITSSLTEGWDYKNLPAMINSLREGSYNRGSETQLGGVAAKNAFRNFQNASVVGQDCGSLLGIETDITAENYQDMIGFYYTENGRVTEVTSENAASLIGTKKYRRSPMLCKTSHTDYCVTCMGRKISENPNALGALAAGVGSTFLLCFMKKMHVANVKVARYDYRTSMT